MQKDTPSGQPLTLQLDQQILFLSQPTIGKINISFDDLAHNMRHQIKDQELVKINYRTVIAALKKTHPQIISAKLQLNPDEIYQLTITVAYEYLPPIIETLTFNKRQIAAEQSEQAAVRNMRNFLQGLKDQFISLTTIQVSTGLLDESNDTEIFAKLNSKYSVFTWSFNFGKHTTNTIKPQMFYYNSITRQRKSSGAIPQQGIYLHSNGESSYIEIKFYAELQDFDMVIFKMSGKNVGEYSLAVERVEQL